MSNLKPLVLIIEDNIDFQNLYGMVAEGAGYDVESILDGNEAISRLEREPIPTLVLLDARLPHVGGEEILIAARANKTWAKVPIYILTADIRAARMQGNFTRSAQRADGVLEKGAEAISQLRELFAKYKPKDSA